MPFINDDSYSTFGYRRNGAPYQRNNDQEDLLFQFGTRFTLTF
jgi:hypothetical protein